MASPGPFFLNRFEIAELTWTIDKFAHVDHQVRSPVFSEPNSSTEFHLELSFSTENNSKTCLSLIYHGPKEEALFEYNYSIVDSNGEKRHTRGHLWHYNKSLRYHKYDLTFYKSRDKCEKLLVNGSLKIYCQTILYNSSLPSQMESFGKLSQNYETLLESGKFSDFIVQIGEKQLNVHKTVLATRSEVFAAMFEHDETKEVKEGRVVIEDVDVEVFELLIRYIYTGKLDQLQLDEHAVELFVVADKYQLDQLKSICEQFLISSLTSESVSGFLLLSDMHNAEKLKSKCIEYMVEHPKEVIQTKGWKELAKSKRNDLIVDLFEKLTISIADD